MEYVRNTTAERYGDALMNRIKRDNTANFWMHFINPNSRVKGDLTLMQYAQRESCDFLLKKCEEADPTSTNSYVQWIVQRYISGGIQRFEDIESTCADYLEQYEDIKRSGWFKRCTDPVMKSMADINKINSLFTLRSVLNGIPANERISNTAADKNLESEMIAKGEAEIFLDNSTCLVMSPHSQRASCHYGRNTQWCTASKRNNMFSTYIQDGPLFIILDKRNNKRWQLSFDSSQFMDENDSAITTAGWSEIPEEALNPIFYKEAIDACEVPSLEVLMNMRVEPFTSLAKNEYRRIASEDEEYEDED